MAKTKVTKSVVKRADQATQSDEVDLLGSQIAAEAGPSTEFDSLTKEQLILRLKFAQMLAKKQDRILTKTEEERVKLRGMLQELWQNSKLLMIEHRENYSVFKQNVADTVTIFANGNNFLSERLEEARTELEEDRKQMRNVISSNEVASAKAKSAVKLAKSEYDETIKQLEKLNLRVERAEKDRVFIKQQYDELVDKRNQQIFTQEALCPKCKANKQCLDELINQFTTIKAEKRKLEDEHRTAVQSFIDCDVKLKDIERLYKRVAHEKDVYRDHMEHMKKGKKGGQMLLPPSLSPHIHHDSPISNGKHEGSCTPSYSNHSQNNEIKQSPSFTSSTSSPSKNISQLTGSDITNSPVPKKEILPAPVELSQKEHSQKARDLEDGEVISPNNDPSPVEPEVTKQPVIAAKPIIIPAKPITPKANKSKVKQVKTPAKRAAKEAISNKSKKKKAKKMDYIYVVDDKPPPLMCSNAPGPANSSFQGPQDYNRMGQMTWRTDSQPRLQVPPLYCDTNAVRRPAYSPSFPSPHSTYSPMTRPQMMPVNQNHNNNVHPDQYHYGRSPTYQLSPRDTFQSQLQQHNQSQIQRFRAHSQVPAPPYQVNGGSSIPWHDANRQQPRHPQQNDSWVLWRR